MTWDLCDPARDCLVGAVVLGVLAVLDVAIAAMRVLVALTS